MEEEENKTLEEEMKAVMRKLGYCWVVQHLEINKIGKTYVCCNKIYL